MWRRCVSRGAAGVEGGLGGTCLAEDLLLVEVGEGVEGGCRREGDGVDAVDFGGPGWAAVVLVVVGVDDLLLRHFGFLWRVHLLLW